MSHRWIYVWMCLALLACKDDMDEEPPVVSISAPTEGSTILMPDTIAVAAMARDNKQLSLLNYGLVDADLNWVGERVYISNPANPTNFNQTLVVSDLDIASGTHYVEVLASDGENDEREFVQVNVIGIPRTYQGLSYLYPAGSETSLAYREPDGSTNLLTTAEGLRYDADGRQAAAYVYAPNEQSLRAYGLETMEVEWTATGVVSSQVTIVDMHYDPVFRRIYLLSDEPRMYSYSYQGTSFGSFELNSDYTVRSFVLSEEDIWLLSNSSTGYRLSRIFKSSGFEIEHFSLGFTPLQLATRGDEDIILIDDAGDVHVVDTQTGSQFLIPTVGTEPVHSLIVAGETAYFASSSSIFQYVAGSGQAPSVYSGSGITGMAYDEIGERMIVAEGSELRFFDRATWQLLGFQALSNGASDLKALFNK